MSRRGLAILATVTMAALLATCGGGGEVTKQEYETALQATMDDLESAYGDAGSAQAGGGGASRSVDEQVAELRTAQVAIRDAGNRLDEIEPPAELAETHDELVAGVREMADAVDLLVGAQEQAEADPAEAKRLMREFAGDESFDRVQAAAAELSDAGVDAGL